MVEDMTKPTHNLNVAKTAQRTLLTVRQFCERHPAFTQGGVRWMLFNREQNGLDRAVVKVGRRVLIDVSEFFRWIDEQNGR